MRNNCLIVIFMIWMNGFSQETDSLSISYSIGYSCSYIVDSTTLRGGCMKKETIDYIKTNTRYNISSYKSKETFREWKGEFQPNLIKDSVRTVKSFGNKKMHSKPLDNFLKEITAIESDTVFPYLLKDVPVSFYGDHSEMKLTATKAETDSILENSFFQVKVSSVVTILCINFKYEGKKYSLKKAFKDAYWTLYFPDNDEKTVRFIYFYFDRFLSKNLPGIFSGKRVLKIEKEEKTYSDGE